MYAIRSYYVLLNEFRKDKVRVLDPSVALVAFLRVFLNELAISVENGVLPIPRLLRRRILPHIDIPHLLALGDRAIFLRIHIIKDGNENASFRSYNFV